MSRIGMLALACLACATSSRAQMTTDKLKSDDGRAVVATYAAKPDYPYWVRARHIQGTGVFQVHIRANGTVRSIDTIQSTRQCWAGSVCYQRIYEVAISRRSADKSQNPDNVLAPAILLT